MIPKTKEIRARRRADAEARNAIHAKHSTAEQLALIATRRGNSKKEVARLTAIN